MPSGRHTITVDVVDGDWMSVNDFTFEGYVSSRLPKINIYGIGNGSNAFLWAQNAQHNWQNVNTNAEIPSIPESTTTIHGLSNGMYSCEWWDTWDGVLIKQQIAVSADGKLTLALPPLSKDSAVAIRRR